MSWRLLAIMGFAFLSMGYGRAFAQAYPLPADFKFDPHSDMQIYTKYIVPSVNWLQQTPLNEHKKERKTVNDFVMSWLQINPDLNIGLPEYSLKFHDINEQLLYLFMEGWIKYTVETKDNNVTNGSIAGVHSMLDYYKSGKAVGLGKSEFLDNLSAIEQQGKLKELFDSSGEVKNTYLYLTPPAAKHQFRHDENYFNFNFYCINLLKPRNIVYRYALAGYFDDWITTKDGSITYPRLPPGDYKFMVQGSMYPNFAHASEASWSFTVGKPLWKENWFLVLSGMTVLLIGYFVIKQREKNLQSIAVLKHERIMFEYEHLKSQVNPHFLFNSLNTLTNLIARDQKKAIEYTENLSSLYHSILAYHDNDLVSLAEEIAILENYFSIQKGRFGDALQLQMNISAEVLRTKKIVPLALQILIENVIKHNVISEQEPLHIDISATDLDITITNILSPKLSKEKGEGLGLVNIKRRYELLTKKTVSYGIIGNEFIVILPLL
jgi:hypothetical protein